ncbi:flagellar protein FlgN [Bacillus cihuensis]|uniref:flagellar protein FlgN n=1 Tax=Bacillus cihuensis TaxID=1208599 RepID=UPI0004229A86|nr:flagellar protein FlgN [Bacillus cihuensis]
MPTEKIITVLDKLIKLHKGLYELASRKTEIIKRSDMDALTALLNEEQKYVKAIEMIDREREATVHEFLMARSPGMAKATLTEIIEMVDGPEKQELVRLRAELNDEVSHLKEKNSLNQQLIYQSLQYVNLSLDMLRPRPQEYNYEKPIQNKNRQAKSIFDSQA